MHSAAFGRRRLLSGAVGLALGLAVAPTVLPAAAQTAGRRLTLPAPTGSYDVGTVSMRLVDHDRQDPWWETKHDRELMVTLWYPARRGGMVTAWMEPKELAHYRTTTTNNLKEMAKRLELGDVDISLDKVRFPLTHARTGAPVRPSSRPYPVVLYSHGAGESRWLGTTIVEDLASRGYVVVAIDHTYDADAVQFPGGRVETVRPSLDKDGAYSVMKVRIADTRFVLDRLATGRSLPKELADSMDLHRIGMFGHSLGGSTTAQGMANDPRIKAGIDLDGHVIPTVTVAPPMPREKVAELVGEVATRIGERPLMIMSSDGKGPEELGVLMSGFWNKLRGERRFLSIVGTTHASYTDAKSIIYQLAEMKVIPEALTQTVGTINPARAAAAERAYVAAFFDRHLRGDHGSLLDGPSEIYPDVRFFE
ncbi:lipase [Nonomuraea sp. 3-1Str]|uniref:alpha/beta hydrolase family protein n=1 Tax=Nonomuraea sp. 3-1Str TaxID=2929801 RepID=UPI00285E9DEA|nr:lipase [Nonomuraea sp. 3-1Str]MDR8412696.1 lipase [Nonomuraea sp. 3-1Str]